MRAIINKTKNMIQTLRGWSINPSRKDVRDIINQNINELKRGLYE